MMKRTLIIAGIVLLIIVTGSYVYKEYKEIKKTAAILDKLKGGKFPEVKYTPLDGLKDGDIVFQQSLSGQSQAIQLATHSVYTHCGILYKNDNNYFVFEAVEPVKLTLLTEWMGKGKGGDFKVKRLKDADKILTGPVIKKMKQIGEQLKGRHYDPFFEWTNDRLYCSELVWKIYKDATGLEIGRLQQLSDFDLTDPIVKQKLRERYGKKIPLHETVISPASIFNSERLVSVQGF